jgi:RNA polymerase sigma-70 factor (ECF subfamily)
MLMNECTNWPIFQPDVVIARQTTTEAWLNIVVIPDDELHLLERLRNGDEGAFALLVHQYHYALLRIAMIYVQEPATAEEAVQEAWIGVLQGLKHFQGRSSLKTWIFRILTNCAKNSALRERRSIPFSSLADGKRGTDEPDRESDSFFLSIFQRSGAWVSLPENGDEIPEEWLLLQEISRHIELALKLLPANQRMVMTLRGIKGWRSQEVCQVLGISEANQRVLLHRARVKVRRAFEQYFNEEEHQEKL